MIVVDSALKQKFIKNKEGKDYVAFYDKDNKLKAVLPVYSVDNLFSEIKRIGKYQTDTKLPANAYELENTLRNLYNNMVSSFICKKTLEYFKETNFADKKDLEKVEEQANKVDKKANEQIKYWADLKALWIGKTVNGLNYHGENPENMYPSLKYATPDMFDRCIPERNNITNVAYGTCDFSIESISEAYVGKAKIAEMGSKKVR